MFSSEKILKSLVGRNIPKRKPTEQAKILS